MKECPVCGSTSFDDMPVCFGCLHRFSEDLHETKDPVEILSALSALKSVDPIVADEEENEVAGLVGSEGCPNELAFEDEDVMQAQAEEMLVRVPRGCRLVISFEDGARGMRKLA